MPPVQVQSYKAVTGDIDDMLFKNHYASINKVSGCEEP